MHLVHARLRLVPKVACTHQGTQRHSEALRGTQSHSESLRVTQSHSATDLVHELLCLVPCVEPVPQLSGDRLDAMVGSEYHPDGDCTRRVIASYHGVRLDRRCEVVRVLENDVHGRGQRPLCRARFPHLMAIRGNQRQSEAISAPMRCNQWQSVTLMRNHLDGLRLPHIPQTRHRRHREVIDEFLLRERGAQSQLAFHQCHSVPLSANQCHSVLIGAHQRPSAAIGAS